MNELVRGCLLAQTYNELLLQDHVLPYIGNIGKDKFVLMIDIARPHASAIVSDEVHIERLN